MRRGLGDRRRPRAFLAAEDGASARGVRRAARGRGADPRPRRARARGSPSTATTTSTACASTAILVRALRTLGADVDWYLPSRIDDGYGLARGHRRAARRARDATCWSPSTARSPRSRRSPPRARPGMDVVVTDHHAPRADGALPDAPIVHPRLGGYPCPDLCAAGVAYKLAQALLAGAGEDPALADEDLDLVALATVADVVPLHGENRRLVRAGPAARSPSTRKPGLRALMDVARVDPSGVDAGAIGFRLAPRHQRRRAAATAPTPGSSCCSPRTASARTRDRRRARRGQRRAPRRRDADPLRGRGAGRRARRRRAALRARRRGLAPGRDRDRRLADRRAPPPPGRADRARRRRGHRLGPLDPGASTCSAACTPARDHLLRYGGHRAAAGLTIAARPTSTRSARRSSRTPPRVLTPEDLVPEERVDAVVPGDALGSTLAEELERLAPFGMGNPAVVAARPGRAARRPARRWGRAGTSRSRSRAGGARSRCVAFGAGSALPGRARRAGRRRRPARGQRLERRRRAAAGPAPARAPCAPRRDRGARRARASRRALRPRSSAATSTPGARRPRTAARRRRRPTPAPRRAARRARHAASPGCSPTSSPPASRVLAVGADAPHRARGAARPRRRLRAHARGRARATTRAWPRPFAHVVAARPAAHAHAALDHLPGEGWTHLAWGAPELRFAHTNTSSGTTPCATRWPPSTAPCARRRCGRGEACEARAPRARGRSRGPRRSPGRLVRVLAELGLVDLDREAPALTVVETPERTALERSPAFRAYQRRLEDGLRFLTSSTPSASGSLTAGDADARRERRRRRRAAIARPRRRVAAAHAGRPRRARADGALRDPGRPHRRSSASCSPTCSRSSRSTPTRSPSRSTAPRRRGRSCSPASTTPTSAASRARTSSSTRSAWRRSAPACASTPRRCAPRCCTTDRRGHDRLARRGPRGVRRRGRRPRRRRHQAHRHHVPVARRGAGRELPQDDGRDGHGHPGHPDQARRPPAQHAHARRDAQAEADREGQGDPRDLRAARAPARHPRDQVGARGPRVRDAAPAQVPGDQGPGQPAARGARALRRQGRRLPRARSSRRSASTPRSQAAPSTSTRSTRR